MAYGYMGRTTIDAAASVAVIMLLIALAIGLAAPARALKRVNDEARTDDVRNLMEAMLEMQTVAPQNVDRLRAAVEAAGAEPRVMFGTGKACAGDHGVQCDDMLLADTCVDAGMYGLADYLPAMPVDAGNATASFDHTGYYVTFTPRTLEIGACNPELQETIRLERTFY